MSDLENAVIDVANMQADELFAERVQRVICDSLGYDMDGRAFPKEQTILCQALEGTIRNIIHNEISRRAQAYGNSSLQGNAQQGYPQYQGTSVLGGLFK